ncbi:hypothetical protein CN235_18055 [Sinorhizobium meliloti]|uniref:hypothetical protein n=1 Tax=Rhizobium meliloti TaxID=382 RepID=UPI000FD2A383|nr:hypothetical protein [Sinorhizobium meliloti]RVE92452.1 hypothetical protein CN235_18055 [Sinorhizobium meliloti]
MMTDKSYTPLDTEFRAFISKAYAGCQFSEQQIGVLRSGFFAGASAALGLVRDRPTSEEIMLLELEDYAHQLEAA